MPEVDWDVVAIEVVVAIGRLWLRLHATPFYWRWGWERMDREYAAVSVGPICLELGYA